MNWTDKHQKFCIKHKLTGCVREMYEYLVQFEGENCAIEVDLKHEFNEWVAKRRGNKYHRDTLKRAWDKLRNLGLIRVNKQYTWAVWSCMLISINQLKPRKKSGKRSSPRGFAPSKDSNCDDTNRQQQHIFSDLLSRVNIKLQPKYLKRLLKFSKNEMEKAIALYQFRSSTSIIHNPPGWIIECLHNAYWLDDKRFQAVFP